MPQGPTPARTRVGAAAGVAGATAVLALVLGAGPAPSVFQLAGANEDVSGRTSSSAGADGSTSSTAGDGTTSTTVDSSTWTTAGGGAGGTVSPADGVRSLDARGAGTVIYAVEGGSLRLVSATPAAGWRVEVEQSAGREVELDLRSGAKRVQVNLEIEDGHVRERVRFRDDADGTDIRTEDGVVRADDRGSGSSSSGHDDSDGGGDHSGPGSSGSDQDRDDSGSSGRGRDHPEDG